MFVGRQVGGDGDTVDLGVVVVELLELDGVGAVQVNESKAHPDLLVVEVHGAAREFFEQE